MDRLRAETSRAIEEGYSILILSDRGVDEDNAPIPSLLATAGVHHHLIREGTRTKCGIVVESGEPRDIAHLALLVGYGAGAVNPYMVFETMAGMIRDGYFMTPIDLETAQYNFLKAAHKGVVKIMAKMGISTIQSYRGAQIFEAVGLNAEFIDEFFAWTPSRIGGIGIDEIEEESRVQPLVRICGPGYAVRRRRAAGRRRVLPVAQGRRVSYVEPRPLSPSCSTPPSRTAGRLMRSSRSGRTTTRSRCAPFAGCWTSSGQTSRCRWMRWSPPRR